MVRYLWMIFLALLVSVSLHAQSPGAGNQSLEGLSTRASSTEAQQAHSPRAFIESHLGGKVVKLEKDPSDTRRAVLLVERSRSITRHVLEADLDSDRELREARIVTTDGHSTGIPPVISMPLSVASKCWVRCKEACGQGTDCRIGCLFDCIVN